MLDHDFLRTWYIHFYSRNPFTLRHQAPTAQFFVEQVGETSEPRGSKTQMVLEAIAKMPGTFSLADLERACPGVSRDMIRRVLNAHKGQSVDCIGRGPGALWQRRGN